MDQPFLMPVEDVFSIKGRGTVVTGRIERGEVKVNEEIEIVGFGKQEKVVVTGVEMFHKTLEFNWNSWRCCRYWRGIERGHSKRSCIG